MSRALSKTFLSHAVFALAFFIFFAQFSSFSHLLLVRHEKCPEHGELIHAGENSTPHDQNQERADSDAITSAERSDGHHRDLHCGFLLDRRESSLPRVAPSFVAHVFTNEIRIAGEIEVRAPAIDLLLTAPKNSPPV